MIPIGQSKFPINRRHRELYFAVKMANLLRDTVLEWIRTYKYAYKAKDVKFYT